MTDRELLEVAAKVCAMPIGIGLGEYAYDSTESAMVRANADGTATVWNPLVSDADAFRLAVMLHMTVFSSEHYAEIEFGPSGDRDVIIEESPPDPYAAARRAIVRAAALSEPAYD